MEGGWTPLLINQYYNDASFCIYWINKIKIKSQCKVLEIKHIFLAVIKNGKITLEMA